MPPFTESQKKYNDAKHGFEEVAKASYQARQKILILEKRIAVFLKNELRAELPASVEVHTLYDRSVPIQDSVHEVKFTLMLTLFLVVMVIFIFLRNVSATVIPR